MTWASPMLEKERQAPRRTLPLPCLCRPPPLGTMRSTTDEASFHQECLLQLPRAECQRFLCWNPHRARYISGPSEEAICCLQRRASELEDPPWWRFRMFSRTFESESNKKGSSPVLKKSHHMILFLCTNGVMKQIPIASTFVICFVHLESEGPISKILLILVWLERYVSPLWEQWSWGWSWTCQNPHHSSWCHPVSL